MDSLANGDPAQIRAWQRLDPGITTSGRITAEDIDSLAFLGVRHVINLALASHPEALANEDVLLAAKGIGYTHIPVPFDAPDERHFEAFCRALDQAGRPVHVHCIANWRVSAFFYRHGLAFGGLTGPEARARMAQQWSPETSDHPDAPAWARFISATDS